MPGSASSEQPPSLRAEQVAQTRAALVAAGRRLFGQSGFRGTSVEDLAREARVTTGALYHHFPTKTALFEAVFVQAHTELWPRRLAAMGATDGLDDLALRLRRVSRWRAQPDVQRIWCWTGPRCWAWPGAPSRRAVRPRGHREIAEGAAKAGTIRIDETATRLLGPCYAARC
jgi:AcrR family transcriptional regulator